MSFGLGYYGASNETSAELDYEGHPPKPQNPKTPRDTLLIVIRIWLNYRYDIEYESIWFLVFMA